MAISIDFACNDPDNGNFYGKFHMMQVRVGDDDLEFDGPAYQADGIRIKFDVEHVHVGRIKVPILGYREWVGNWCWNSVSVHWPEAIRIINYVGQVKWRDKHVWHMSSGSSDLFDIFNERHEITPMEWKLSNEERHK